MTTTSNSVLVVGSGGREHALAWKLAQSPSVSRVIVAPGNDGYPAAWERWETPLGEGRPAFEKLARRARAEGVSLVVIGPDNPLAAGIADVMAAHDVRCFGPTAAAARIEASKAFAKEVMQAAGVPTARFFVAHSSEEARKILKSVPWNDGWVVKADGLALGKGVVVCAAPEEALSAAENLIGISGQLVIEERLRGEEISWMAFCSGTRCALLDPARDYKRLRDGDQGPNTGGMGAFSPVPGIPEHFAERVRNEVFLPTLKEMSKRGCPFSGVLYAGLMVDARSDRIWVLEFNARFGDPETQVLMPRFNGDLYRWCESVAKGELGEHSPRAPFTADSAVVVIGAAAGYPENPEKGRVISGPITDVGYFNAGVARREGGLVTSGGRVFGSLGIGPDLRSAREQAYQRMRKISFAGMQFRGDVGESAREMKR